MKMTFCSLVCSKFAKKKQQQTTQQQYKYSTADKSWL